MAIGEIPAHSHTRGTMNITGTFNPWSERDIGNCTGAFYEMGVTNAKGNGSTSDSDNDYIGFDASRSWTGETSTVGSSQSHNIMQPYISCYLWRRTA